MKRLLTIILVILLLPSASLGDSFADMLEKAENYKTESDDEKTIASFLFSQKFNSKHEEAFLGEANIRILIEDYEGAFNGNDRDGPFRSPKAGRCDPARPSMIQSLKRQSAPRHPFALRILGRPDHHIQTELVIIRPAHIGHQTGEQINDPEEAVAVLFRNPAQNNMIRIILCSELVLNRHINILVSKQEIRQMLLGIKVSKVVIRRNAVADFEHVSGIHKLPPSSSARLFGLCPFSDMIIINRDMS